MAETKQTKPAEKAKKKYIVKTPVKDYCGVGAAGIHFANGKAVVYEGPVLDWFREHKYVVEEITD